MVQEVALAGLLGPEYEDNAILRNVGNYSTKDTVLHSNNNIALEQLRTEGGVWGVQPHPPKLRRFDKVEPDCKLGGKCLVFLFQHPN